MRQKNKLFLVFLTVILLFMVSFPAHAQLVKCKNNCQISDLIQTIFNILDFLLGLAWLVCVIFIVWSGWGMINASGNEEAISSAKTTFRNAVIGFFVIMISFVLINFVVSLLTGNGEPRANALQDMFKLVK